MSAGLSAAAAALYLALLIVACSRSGEGGESAAPSSPSAFPLPAAPSKVAEPVASPLPAPPSSREHCLEHPFVPDLEIVPTLAELERGSCDGNARLQVLYRPGPKPPRPGDLDGLVAAITPALVKELGVEYVAQRRCCHTKLKKQEICLSVRLPLCAQPLERVAQVFANQVKATPFWTTGVGLVVEYTGHAGPRCTAQGKSCQPLPYWSDTLRPEVKAAGHVTPPYDPALGRERVDIAEHELNMGSCVHDGDCVRLGCGNHCAAWYTPEFGAGCPAYLELSNAHCGCVTRQCAWFTQVPEAH